MEICTGAVTGTMSKRALALVEEWRLLNVDALLDNWELASTKQSLRPIDPLE